KALPKNQRSFVHEVDPNLPNFYIVAAVDTAGNNSMSLTTYGHLIDSIAPSAPTGLKGVVDTSGLVHLSWNSSIEPDLLGYTLQFSNDSSHVFTTLTNKPIADTFYTDTIMISSLTEHVYYRLIAVDRSFNYSEASPFLGLIKPDIVPP